MSLFSTILSKVFGNHDKPTPSSSAPRVATPDTASFPTDVPLSPVPPPSSGAAPGASSGASLAAASNPASQQATPTDVAAVLDGLAAKNPEELNWRRSIVDLMKLLDMDSSLGSRKELATELHYQGDQSDSSTMNVWLHHQVLKKLAENGGKVPSELLD